MAHEPETKKSLGQHWLNDQSSLEAITDAASLDKDDVVVEVGPGPGSLTKLLVTHVSRVIAVELDANLAEALPVRVRSQNLSVVNEDILKFDLNSLPRGYKLVTNLPYYLTSNFIRVISESTNPPLLAVLLVQKEVAERIAAATGKLSVLGATAQYYWQPRLDKIVPSQLFTPPPKVDSQIVLLKRRPAPLYPEVDPKTFFKIIKAGFSQKRKTLLNSLSAGLRLEKSRVSLACNSVGIDPSRRPQTLSLDEWHSLYTSLIT